MRIGSAVEIERPCSMTSQRWNLARRRLAVVVLVLLGIGGSQLCAQVSGPDIDPFEDLTATPASDVTPVPGDESAAPPAEGEPKGRQPPPKSS